MAQIIVELPDHLVKDFLGWISHCGEQDYYEAYQDGSPERKGKFVNFTYPGWQDKIVITEITE